MKRISTFSLIVLILYAFCFHASSQNKADSLTEEMKSKMYNTFKHFTVGFYIDSYCNLTLDDRYDTSNVVPFSANCPVRDQIRLNYAALEMYYNAEKVRGKFVLQYGDAPNLLASPDAQFIKSIRQANFGFRIVKNLWVDLGYLFNPVEYESAWPVINQISTVTIGGYFSPGSVLGIKFSYKFNDKFSGGIMAGNPFSLAYQHNTRIAGIIFLTYKPLPNLSLNYNNFFGNQALKTAEIKNNTVYNNIFVTYDPVKQVGLVGQFDFAFQTNSKMPPDTTMTAGIYSGFLQARYAFLGHFAITGRYEFFNDPEGFLSGTYTFDGKTRGLHTEGFCAGFEYKPVNIGYIRLEYRYLRANKGNLVFYDNTSDHMQALIITTGVRF